MYRDLIGVACLAVSVLILSYVLLDAGVLHVSALGMALSDQVGYLQMARNFAENGNLESGVIYPSTLNQEASRSYLYMPGYYVFLGLSMKLFGGEAILLPGYLSFVAAALCLYLIGSRLYRRAVGLIAAVLFCLFPSHVIFANTVMSEVPFLAATLLAFCLFVYTPEKYKFYAPPLLLALPFVFRETGALLVIPMMLMLVDWKNSQYALKMCGTLLASIMVLVLIYSLDFSSGRPSLLAPTLLSGGFSAIYSDAFWMPPLDLSWMDYSRFMMINLTQNVGQMAKGIQNDFLTFEVLTLVMTFSLAVMLMMHPILLKKWDPLLVGVILMLAATLALILTLYTMMDFRGVRHLMFIAPFLILGATGVLYQLRVHKFALVAALLMVLAFGTFAMNEVSKNFSYTASQDERLIRLFEAIGHDDKRMLVANVNLALPYAAKHNTKWAFVPSNTETLKLLGERYNIGTFAVAAAPEDSPELVHALGQIGLRYKGILKNPLNSSISGLHIYQGD